jgi:site-specific recombinase XerD
LSAVTDASLPIDELIDDFERSLRARRRAAKTITAYTDAAHRFARWAEANGQPTTVEAVERRHVEAWIIDQLEAHSPSTAAGRYRYLQQFWRWVVEEGERAGSPMEGMSPPTIPERPVPVYERDELRSLLKVTEGQGFEQRRDHALIRTFIATGVRLGEMAGMTLDSLGRDEQAVLVIGKGDRGRWVPYSDRAATALDRYMRERRRHPQAGLEWLWIGQRGRLTSSGITQVLRRRAREAGVAEVRPHRFRHTFAHEALDAGMAEGDLQELAGWRSPQMLARYGASARAERARRAYRRVDIEGDL